MLAGCVPQGAPKATFTQGLSVIGVQQIDRVVEVVEETLKGNTVRLMGTKKQNGKKIGGASLLLPKVRRNPLIEIIAINTGCLNQCTYCKTKHARGDLGSYPPEEIVARAKQAFEEGVVEIWLTSEDTGIYFNLFLFDVRLRNAISMNLSISEKGTVNNKLQIIDLIWVLIFIFILII